MLSHSRSNMGYFAVLRVQWCFSRSIDVGYVLTVSLYHQYRPLERSVETHVHSLRLMITIAIVFNINRTYFDRLIPLHYRSLVLLSFIILVRHGLQQLYSHGLTVYSEAVESLVIHPVSTAPLRCAMGVLRLRLFCVPLL